MSNASRVPHKRTEYMRSYREKNRKEIRKNQAKYRKTKKYRAAKKREVDKRDAGKVNGQRRSRRFYRNNAKATRQRPATCECCERPTDNLVFDHDHRTGEFRGWLCHECNLGIGKLGDDIHGIKDALAYLEKVNGKISPN